jgi:hypothetical protein
VLLGPSLPSQQLLTSELALTIANPDVWLSIGVALLLGLGCLLVGIWATRTVGLLSPEVPAGETFSVGLTFGLIVVASWWAALWSGGRSSFTPVAIGFAVAIGAAVVQRVRAPRPDSRDRDADAADDARPRRLRPKRSLLVTTLAGGLFVVVIALLYGSTVAPSPREGVQPIEKTDIAFYAVLGRDLATTGTETNTLPSGFETLNGVTAQTWYHWGELWLASAVIKVFGTAPFFARYLVVLPLLLLAVAAMTGTIVRRLARTSSRRAFVFGFVACLVLAPIPLLEGPFFSVWAAGMLYGIAVFGLAAVAVLGVIYVFSIEHALGPSWALAAFVGTAAAFVLPAHIILALLGLAAIAVPVALRIGQSLLKERRLPSASAIWWQTLVATAVAVLVTVAWGVVTDHGLGGGGPLAGIAPFNDSWRGTIAVVTLGAGLLLAPPVAGFVARRDNRLLADACLSVSILVVLGAVLWGWRLATFNMFYLFFGAIAVFATPVAAVAVWSLVQRLGRVHRRRLIIGGAMLCLVQLEFGLMLSVAHLQGQPSPYEPIPVSLLDAIRRLPAGAKLAYGCRSFEEISFVNSKLLGIDANTGHRIVPLCFEPDVNGPLLGAPVTDQVPDAGFAFAPQAALYPNASAKPTAAAVSTFLKSYGIEYLYADAQHPNLLVPDAVPVVTVGDHQVLRIP